MTKCKECGEDVSMPYQCNICSRKYCSDHRLPEKHNCEKLQRKSVSGEEAIKTSRKNQNDSMNIKSRLTQSSYVGNMTEYILNNVSYSLLGLMLMVYILQILTISIFSVNLHNSVFVLNANRIEYVWTWIISIFSHDTSSLFHILGNGFVLFFFGPILEKIVGSKSFLKLFLASGIIAGLSQVLTALVLGSTSIGVLGASGAILCIMGVLTVYKPDMSVYLYFMIPVPLWLITVGYVIFSVVGVLSGSSGIAHTAHLSGLIMGILYGYKYKHNYDNIYDQKRIGSNFR